MTQWGVNVLLRRAVHRTVCVPAVCIGRQTWVDFAKMCLLRTGLKATSVNRFREKLSLLHRSGHENWIPYMWFASIDRCYPAFFVRHNLKKTPQICELFITNWTVAQISALYDHTSAQNHRSARHSSPPTNSQSVPSWIFINHIFDMMHVVHVKWRANILTIIRRELYQRIANIHKDIATMRINFISDTQSTYYAGKAFLMFNDFNQLCKITIMRGHIVPTSDIT